MTYAGISRSQRFVPINELAFAGLGQPVILPGFLVVPDNERLPIALEKIVKLRGDRFRSAIPVRFA
jgi:hypothetical protein